MSLSLDEVRHVAKLARLALSPDEEQRYQKQLSAILEYAAELQALDTTNVPPTSHATELATALHEDVVKPSLPPEVAVKNAPQHEGTAVAVPKIIE